MGWNSGFAKLEQDVIDCYNKGILSKEKLNEIITPYKRTDCDSGGSNYLVSNDGKCMERIICEIMLPNETKHIVNNPIWDGKYEDIGVKTYNDETYPDPYWKANTLTYDLFYSIWNGLWEIW